MPVVASEESEVDIEVEEMQDSSEEDDFEGKDVEEEQGEDELESEPEHSQSTGAAPLKIKLKLGMQAESSKPVSRRSARAKNEDVESEDSDSEDSQFEAYTAGPSTSRQLTARQAVLASAVDPEHVTLDSAPSTSKKAKSTPSEVALRKEENARKRKNMIEKKLENEKAETINRLLKKQSRPKNKRNTAAQSDEDADMGLEEDEDGGFVPAPPALPTMFRWVSTSRVPADLASTATPSASLSFSVPDAFLPAPKEKIVLNVSVAPARCAVAGCGAARKYRAVGKEWGVGACGLGHLRVLEGRS
ncbi:PAPA-1-like conserved region-domain-containing protein [Mycena maculata]|uniref:PAPA-1-like conserved region-domain-containing protein n=1 Tax=Mycena maculata TaxID=230809 RepID=A0AAD7J3J5_9AGAR|nr:PAPA-1-like conserved region-domain-containing protein [Mycena maculata]